LFAPILTEARPAALTRIKRAPGKSRLWPRILGRGYRPAVLTAVFFSWHDRGIPPPHFFASYSGHEANVSIETGEVIEGHLPGNASRLVREWALAHRSELEDNWRRARAGVSLARIAGLDDD
jgi:hypothetical protein